MTTIPSPDRAVGGRERHPPVAPEERVLGRGVDRSHIGEETRDHPAAELAGQRQRGVERAPDIPGVDEQLAARHGAEAARIGHARVVPCARLGRRVANHRGEHRGVRLEVVEQSVNVETWARIPPDGKPPRRPAGEVRRVPELCVDRVAQRLFAVPLQVRDGSLPVATAQRPQETEHQVTRRHDVVGGDQGAAHGVTRLR